MTSSTPASTGSAARPTAPRAPSAALALLAAGGLVLEIALTRLLSALWFDSFVFVLLAVAVLGLGVGAAAATLAPALRRTDVLPAWLAAAGGSAAALVPALLAFAEMGARVPSYALVIVPYACLGAALAALFAAYAEDSPRLYLADLVGAGIGGLIAAPLLDELGAPGAILAAGLALCAGAPLLATRRMAAVAAVPALAVGALLVAQIATDRPNVDWRRLATPKPITDRLAEGAETAADRWDALARTDLVVDSRTGARYLYLDGGAGSLVPDPDRAAAWAGDVGAFAFEAVDPERAFLLGSGGGLDIALARRAGVAEIVAAEVNRASVSFSRALAPTLYGPSVAVHVGEGRSILRRKGRFDLVLLSQTVTQNAELRGIALTENALYTVEAFRTYLSHLTQGGAVALKLYDELTLTRAMTTAVAALATGGRSEADAMAHLFAVLDPRASSPVPLLLVRDAPLSRAEAVAYARTAERMGYALLYVPGLLEPPPLDALAGGAAGLDDVIAASPEADLSPPTDRRPFFWQFEPGVPRALRPLLWALAGLLAAGAAAYALAWRGIDRTIRLGLPVALALGAGFMLAEVSLLQRVQLLVGNPTLALGATLGVLLIGAGIGSAVSGRSRASPLRIAASGALLAAATLVAVELAWPGISDATTAQGTPARLLAALVPVAAVALPMGAPFPHLLRALGRTSDGGVAAAWAVNGFASVLGAVGATALAVVVGFPAVTGAAVACYLAAAILSLGDDVR